MAITTKTLKVRIKDKHARVLQEWSRAVNFTWNYINELSSRSIREKGKFLSAYDLQKYTDGAGKELGLHSHTIQCVGKEYRDVNAARNILALGHERLAGGIPALTAQAAASRRGRGGCQCPAPRILGERP